MRDIRATSKHSLHVVSELLLASQYVLAAYRSSRLSAVQGRDEDNLVSVLQLVIAFTFKLPVCIIHEYENARPPAWNGL